MVIKRFGVASVAKVLGAAYATIGLIAGFFVTLAAAVGGVAAIVESQDVGGGAAGMLFGVGAIVFFPIFYGLIGFVSGAIGALIYNLFAGIVGGVEIDVETAPRSVAGASYPAGGAA